jgi:ssRNA-specific RNase YbeY (16S rRNA maturation enzyme)
VVAQTHGFIHICDGFDDYMVKVESRLFTTEEEAIEAWNRRVSDGI